MRERLGVHFAAYLRQLVCSLLGVQRLKIGIDLVNWNKLCVTNFVNGLLRAVRGRLTLQKICVNAKFLWNEARNDIDTNRKCWITMRLCDSR